MRFRVLSCSFAVLLVCSVAPARADLKLEFHQGFVTIDAKNVTVRQILAEWARLGGTRVVNGERVAGAPVTLQLVNVPERQALEVLLRSVSGYLAAPRALLSKAGASMFDRILVMPTSTSPTSAPRPPAPAAVAYPGQVGPGMQAGPGMMPGQIPRPMPGMQPPPQVADEQGEDDEPDQDGDIAPAPVPPTVTGGDGQPPTSDRPGMPTGYPGSPGGTQPQTTSGPGPAPGGATTPGVILQPPPVSNPQPGVRP